MNTFNFKRFLQAEEVKRNLMSLEWSLATIMYYTTLCISATSIYFHLKFCKLKSYLTSSDGLINADDLYNYTDS